MTQRAKSDTFLKDGSSEAIILLDEKKRQNRPTVDNDILQLCEKLVDEIDKFQNYDDRRAFAARLDSIDNLDNAKTALENFIVEIEDIQKEL